MKNDNGITNEELKDYCHANKWASDNSFIGLIEIVCKLARALLAEREEREDMQDVWKDAPEWATMVCITYHQAHVDWSDDIRHKCYTRTIPKTGAREKAEEVANDLSISTVIRKAIADRVEIALNEWDELYLK